MGQLLPITLEDMRAELARESAARAVVYPKLVASGSLRADRVEWRAAVMSAIGQALDELERLHGWPPGQMRDEDNGRDGTR